MIRLMDDASLLIAIQRRYNGDIMDYISNLATSFIFGVPFRWKSGITLVLSCKCQKSGCRMPSFFTHRNSMKMQPIRATAICGMIINKRRAGWWLTYPEKYESIGMMISFIWKNRKRSKPRNIRELCFHGN